MTGVTQDFVCQTNELFTGHIRKQGEVQVSLDAHRSCQCMTGVTQTFDCQTNGLCTSHTRKIG